MVVRCLRGRGRNPAHRHHSLSFAPRTSRLGRRRARAFSARPTVGVSLPRPHRRRRPSRLSGHSLHRTPFFGVRSLVGVRRTCGRFGFGEFALVCARGRGLRCRSGRSRLWRQRLRPSPRQRPARRRGPRRGIRPETSPPASGSRASRRRRSLPPRPRRRARGSARQRPRVLGPVESVSMPPSVLRVRMLSAHADERPVLRGRAAGVAERRG